MYYKMLEYYIILCLINQLTIVPYVNGRPTDNEENTVIFPEEEFQALADSVCSDLKYVMNVSNNCVQQFWGPDLKAPKLAPMLKIRCQTKHSIRFEIQPSENWQLVLLVPKLTNDTINYSLVNPKTKYWDISTIPYTHYTIWSTILKDGVPEEWRGGDLTPVFNESAVSEHRIYDIKMFLYLNENYSSVDVRFVWNTISDEDVCFDVVNHCDYTGIASTKVWPNKNNYDPEVEFENISLDDECHVIVIGLYGTTKYSYHTPTCTSSNCTDVKIKPEIPQNVVLMANEHSNSSGKWDVHVSWSKPQRLPDFYNVTLRTHVIHTMVLPGSETEAVFRKLPAEGFFNVTIYATLGSITAVTSRRSVFPGGSRGGVGGAVVGAGCAAAAALAMLFHCRRRRQSAVPAYKLDYQPSKDCDTEVLEIWSEPEDRWEVRTEKLVLHEVIGEGAFGVVRRATLAPHSLHVAVKMLKDFPSLEEIRSFRSEMELMKSVGSHPHLVSLVGCCSGRRPLIIAEYCSRGDLLSYLRCTWDVMLYKRNAKYYNNNIDISDYRNDLFKRKTQMEDSKLVVNKLYELQEICDKELTSIDLLSFCRQIAMGMEFLAANRVVHRDLAARNVLVTADRTLKIADFGLSRDVYEENQYKQKGNGKMPVKWMALESLTRKIYTTQSDVWSFGVVVWEIATVGGAPYASVPISRLPRLLRAGYRMPKPNNCSQQLYDIMLSCWRTHPRDRPTFAELHQRLDDLLNNACANQYLSLEIETDDAPPTPKHYRYIKMLIRGKRNLARGENYERPLKASSSNHYTTPPDSSLSTHPT